MKDAFIGYNIFLFIKIKCPAFIRINFTYYQAVRN